MVQYQRFLSNLVLAPQTVTNGATVTASFDTSIGGSKTNSKALYVDIDVCFASQVNTNAVNPTIQLLESDDTVVTNFATITANVNPTLTAAGIVRYCVDMKPRKRWLKVSVGIPTATNDNQVVAVIAHERFGQEPASTTDLISSGTAVIVN